MTTDHAPITYAPYPPFPAPPRREHRSGPWVVSAAALLIAASTGAYVVVTNTHDRVPAPPAPAPVVQFSPAQVAAAKDNLCSAFDMALRGRHGHGGFRGADGQPNVPMVLRSVNSVLTVQDALDPALPADISARAKNYIKTTLSVTTAALGNETVDEVNNLTDANNEAGRAFADACGFVW
jgi:hypothetical protein